MDSKTLTPYLIMNKHIHANTWHIATCHMISETTCNTCAHVYISNMHYDTYTKHVSQPYQQS